MHYYLAKSANRNFIVFAPNHPTAERAARVIEPDCTVEKEFLTTFERQQHERRGCEIYKYK